MNEFKRNLLKGLQIESIRDLKFSISDHQVNLMDLHAKELIRWNKKVNLTAIKQTLQVADKHFIDCIAADFFIQNIHSIIDLGSGGGFPGIVLKIMNPDLKVVLIDSSRKKISFLKHVIRLLNLKRIDAVHTRVQDIHENILYKNQFDAVISRAFTQLSGFVDLAFPFLNENGTIYAMKGKQIKKEICPELLKKYIIKTYHYTLPFEKSDRYIAKLNIISQ